VLPLQQAFLPKISHGVPHVDHFACIDQCEQERRIDEACFETVYERWFVKERVNWYRLDVLEGNLENSRNHGFI